MSVRTRVAMGIAISLAFGGAMATTMELLGLERMVEESSIAVRGEIMASRVEQTADGPYTLTTLRVNEALWGTNEQTLTVAVPGGSHERGKFRVGTVSPGAPTLLLGRNVVAFLQPDAAHDAYSIVGFSQGVIDVVKADGAEVVTLPGEAQATRWSVAREKLRELRAAARAHERVSR